MCLKNLGSLGDLCTSTIGLVYTHFIFIGSDVIVLYFIDISDRDELNFLFSSQLVNFELKISSIVDHFLASELVLS